MRTIINNREIPQNIREIKEPRQVSVRKSIRFAAILENVHIKSDNAWQTEWPIKRHLPIFPITRIKVKETDKPVNYSDKIRRKMSCCGQITTVRVPIELNNQSDVLKVWPATGVELDS